MQCYKAWSILHACVRYGFCTRTDLNTNLGEKVFNRKKNKQVYLKKKVLKSKMKEIDTCKNINAKKAKPKITWEYQKEISINPKYSKIGW